MDSASAPDTTQQQLPHWREGYTERERELLAQFREEVAHLAPEDERGPEGLPDHFLIRWIRARGGDLTRARTMLANYYSWRAEHNWPACIDPEAWTPPRVIADDLTVRFFGEDAEGRPIVWAPVGRWEVRLRLEEGLKPDLVLFVYLIFSRVLQRIDRARTTRGVTQVVAILDMAELSWRKLSLETLQATTRFFREFEAYFPEIVTTVYVINAPLVFSFVYNFVKPFMSVQTLEKVKVFGYNEATWRPVLAEKFPKEVLPKEYGGEGAAVFEGKGGVGDSIVGSLEGVEANSH